MGPFKGPFLLKYPRDDRKCNGSKKGPLSGIDFNP
jgi:hypothetical protein